MKFIRRMAAVACLSLFLLSLTAAQAATPALSRFSLNDMAVSYVYVNTERADVQWMFGEPIDIEHYTSEATGEETEIWQYLGMSLTFNSEGKLFHAEVSSDAYIGPRGLRVGQTSADVIALFYIDPNLESDTVLYTSGYVEWMDVQFPPFGELRYNEDGTFALHYGAPTGAFREYVEENPINYIYENLALLIVNFDENAVVTDFRWDHGPWAE